MENVIFWHQYIPVQLWYAISIMMVIGSIIAGISFVLGIFFKKRDIK